MNIAETPEFSYKRQFKFGANAFIYVLFVMGIFIFIELISARHNYKVDTTKTGRYSLSPQTLKVLNSLKKDVKATSFFGERQAEEKAAFDELMDQYAYASKMLTYRNIDPDRNPGETKRYKVTTYGTVVLESGDSEQRVSEKSEEKLTNAIIRITKSGKKKVFFLAGHGEKLINAMKEDGFQAAKEAVEQANYETKELTLLPNKQALEGADVLIVPGPRKDLQEAEVNILRAFLKEGGKVFLMVDPFEAPGLVPFAREFGVQLKDDIIIDQMSQFFGADLTMPVVSKYHPHQITKDFNLATFFPLVRSVTALKEKPEYIDIKELLSASPESWAETDQAMLEAGKASFDAQADTKGPVDIGVALTINASGKGSEEGKAEESGQAGQEGARKTEEKTGRMVILGDSDFASNSRINMVGNRDFFLNALSWLAEDTDLISIRPKEAGGAMPVPLTQAQQKIVFLVPVLVWPMLVVAAGIVVFRKRKRMK